MEGTDIFCCWALIWHSMGTRGCADGVFPKKNKLFSKSPPRPLQAPCSPNHKIESTTGCNWQ